MVDDAWKILIGVVDAGISLFVGVALLLDSRPHPLCII